MDLTSTSYTHLVMAQELLKVVLTKPASHLVHTRPLNLMIIRIRSRFVQNIRRRPPQLHPITLKAQIAHPTNIIPIIILHKQCQALYLPEQRSLDSNILNLRGLRQGEFLGGSEVAGGAEIEIVAVDEDFEGLGRGGGG